MRFFRTIPNYLAAAIAMAAFAASSPAAEPTVLDKLPTNTEYAVSVLRLGETAESFGKTNLWKMIKEDKFAKEAWKKFLAQYEAGENNWGPFKAILEDPANKDWPALAADAFSREIFFSAGNGSAELYAAYQEAFGYEGIWQTFLEGAKNPNPGQQDAAVTNRYRAILRSYNAKPDRLKAPNLLFGLKVSDSKKISQQLDRLDGILPMLLKGSKLEGRVEKQKIAGDEFRVITIDKDMIPWKEIEDKLEEYEEKPGEFNPLIAHLKKRTLRIAFGIRQGYLLIAIGETVDHVGSFGGDGDKLAGRAEFKPLAKYAEKPITSIAYVSAKFRQTATPNVALLGGVLEVAKAGLAKAEELPEDQRKAIEKDVDALAKELAKGSQPPKAAMSFSFRSAKGWESFSHDYSPTEGVSKTPLTILNHLDGNPLFAGAYRSSTTVEDYRGIVKWLGVFGKHALKYAETTAPNGDEIAKVYRDLALPLLKELNEIIEKLWFPAVADGQTGIVIDSKWKSMQWHAAMPESAVAIPMFELGLLLGVSDAAKFEKAVDGFRLWANEAYAKVRDLNPAGEVPDFEIPKPPVIKVKGTTLATIALPEAWGLDPQLLPTAGLTDTIAAFTLSRSHTDRLLKVSPWKGTAAPLADAKKPLDSFLYLYHEGLVDTLAPWLEMAVGFAPQPEDGPNLEEYLPKVLSIMRAFKSYSSATFRDATGTVTHSEVILGDVPAAKK